MNALDKSDFIRQLHRLHKPRKFLFLGLGQYLKHLNTEACYVIGSIPVAVYDNVRIRRYRLVQCEAYRSCSASKHHYFFGFKVQLLTTHDGLPVGLYIHAGSKADITGLQALALQLPEGSVLYADAPTPTTLSEDAWRKTEQVELDADCQTNSKRPHES